VNQSTIANRMSQSTRKLANPVYMKIECHTEYTHIVISQRVT